jgi:isopentenyl diphosphate isomerase/L-lactate dehydrogenase-like FMN-dependent dehydrogenase
VQTVVRLLQSETGRTMGLNGKTTIAELDRTVVRMSKH